jgi:hypothetical protein
MPRQRGWPRQAPPPSPTAIRRRCQTRFAETHAAGPAGCATTPSGLRRIRSGARARSGLPPPAGCRGRDDHRDRNTGVRSCGHQQWRAVSSRGLQGMLDNFPPKVLAMLVKLPPVPGDCPDARAKHAKQLSPSRGRWRCQCRRLTYRATAAPSAQVCDHAARSLGRSRHATCTSMARLTGCVKLTLGPARIPDCDAQ